MDEFGTLIETTTGGSVMRYERRYPRPIETVWAAITERERLADWLGDCAVEPRVGGRFDVFTTRDPGDRVTGRVLAWQSPTLLSYSWQWPGDPETVVRYELTADGPHATRLVFTHTDVTPAKRPLVLPGWHVFLERLGQLVGGTTPDAAYRERFLQVKATYEARAPVV